MTLARLDASSTQTAVQHALVEQTAAYIAQYTPNPRIVSYASSASGDVMGKFESQGRVFTFRLSNKGLIYKPFVQRKDSESEDDHALRFDFGSDLYLENFDPNYRSDAAKAFKPKPSVSIPATQKQRGSKTNPNCSAISYHCGVCISLGKNCIKNANTTALKERLNKINSLSRMAAKGEAVPKVKTGAIGANVDPKSLMKKAQGQAREQFKGDKKNVAPSQILSKVEPKKLEVYERLVDRVLSKDKDGSKKANLLAGNDYDIREAYFNIDNRLADRLSLKELRENGAAIGSAILQRDAKLATAKVPTAEPAKATPQAKIPDIANGAVHEGNIAQMRRTGDLYEVRSKNSLGEEKFIGDKAQAEKVFNDAEAGTKREAAEKYRKAVYTAPVSTSAARKALVESGAKSPVLGAVDRLLDPKLLTADKDTQKQLRSDLYGHYRSQRDANNGAYATKINAAINEFDDNVRAHNKKPESEAKVEAKPESTAKPKVSLNPNEWGTDFDKHVDTLANIGYKLGLPNPRGTVKLLRGKDGDYDSLEGTTYVKQGKSTLTSAGDSQLHFLTTNANRPYGHSLAGLSVEIKEHERRIGAGVVNLELPDRIKNANQANYLAEAIGQKAPYPQAKKYATGDESQGMSNYLNEGSYELTPKGERLVAKVKEDFLKQSSESNYVPLTSERGLSDGKKRQQRSTDQITIDRAKSDVGNATKTISKIDDSIKKLKAGGGLMNEADTKKVTQLERQKSEWETTRTGHRAKVEGLSGKGVAIAGNVSAAKPVEPRLAQTDLFGNPVAIPEAAATPAVTVVAKPKAKKQTSSKVDVFTPEMKAHAEKVLKDAEKGLPSIKDFGFKDQSELDLAKRYGKYDKKTINNMVLSRDKELTDYIKKNLPDPNSVNRTQLVEELRTKVAAMKADIEKRSPISVDLTQFGGSKFEVQPSFESVNTFRDLLAKAKTQTSANTSKSSNEGLARGTESEYKKALESGDIDKSTYDLLVGNTSKEFPDTAMIQGVIRKTKTGKPLEYGMVKTNAKKIGNYAIHQSTQGTTSDGEAITTNKQYSLSHPASGLRAVTSDDMGDEKTALKVKKARLEAFANELSKRIPDIDPIRITPEQRDIFKELKEKAKRGDYDPRKDSADLYHVRIPNSILVSRTDACDCVPNPDGDRIISYIKDNSGNMMGICQMQGIKYRFMKPVIGDTVLTPVSETNLAYLFDLAPDLSLMGRTDSVKKR